jgi:hypothetical protein
MEGVAAKMNNWYPTKYSERRPIARTIYHLSADGETSLCRYGVRVTNRPLTPEQYESRSSQRCMFCVRMQALGDLEAWNGEAIRKADRTLAHVAHELKESGAQLSAEFQRHLERIRARA